MSSTQISVNDLTWGQRFAIIKRYNLTDEQASEKLGVTVQEINTARGLIEKGIFQIDDSMNVEPYGILFGYVDLNKPKINIDKSSQKRRGRKGTKIVECFQNIPETPIPAEEHLKKYNVSLPVLRQHKRFDKTGLPGTVVVKKDKNTGILMVWREKPAG